MMGMRIGGTFLQTITRKKHDDIFDLNVWGRELNSPF
jgi:hypothetical protein